MSAAKHPALVALSDEKKEKLRILHAAFNLDWANAEIHTGEDARAYNERMGDAPFVSDEQGNVIKRYIPTSKSDILETEPAKCAIASGDLVRITDAGERIAYEVTDVLHLPYGRTGFWCKLKYQGGTALRKPVEASRLEVVPLPSPAREY